MLLLPGGVPCFQYPSGQAHQFYGNPYFPNNQCHRFRGLQSTFYDGIDDEPCLARYGEVGSTSLSTLDNEESSTTVQGEVWFDEYSIPTRPRRVHTDRCNVSFVSEVQEEQDELFPTVQDRVYSTTVNPLNREESFPVDQDRVRSTVVNPVNRKESFPIVQDRICSTPVNPLNQEESFPIIQDGVRSIC